MKKKELTDEAWANHTLQKWKPALGLSEIDFEEQEQMGALAKRNKRVMTLLLRELEIGTDPVVEADQHPPRYIFVSTIALLLGRSAAEESIPSLLRILKNKREYDLMRSDAARALGLIGYSALPAIYDAISKSPDSVVRAMVVDALSAIVAPHRAMPRPVNCAIDPYELLITAMKDKAAPVRDAALGVYEAAIPPEVGEHYIYPALQSPNPFVRAGAADVLVNYKLHQQEAEQAICDLLKHSNVDVRLQALRGVRRENRKYSKALAEPLNHALVDENAVIRAGAARGLANLGRWAAPAKENLLALVRRPFESEGDLIAGAEAARALGHIRAKEAVPDFVNLLKINDYELRLNVVNAIGDIGLEAQSAIPELKDLLKLDYSDLRTAVRTTIAKILQKKKS